MELYESEEQQLEAIKKWFGENGRAIVVGLVIGISGILAWNGWQSYKTARALAASNLFQELLNAAESNNADSLVKLADNIKKNYPDSAYADYAHFFLAKHQVESQG